MPRILQVVGGMDRAGVETWLLSILRQLNRDRFQMDFLVHRRNGAYESDVEALGARIVPCFHPKQPWLYARHFNRAVREYGPYDIIHSHLNYFNGPIMLLAHHAGIPRRIAHCHLDVSPIWREAKLLRRAYMSMSGIWIGRHSTHCLATSRVAGESMYGSIPAVRSRWEVAPCGIDFAPFRQSVNRAQIRDGLGIEVDTLIVGHVGRFDVQKNHAFLIEIARETVIRKKNTRFLLVGDGPLRSEVRDRIDAAGLSGHFQLVGSRPDVASLMLGAMDVFLFPSRYEGLGLALVEAQAAGLPCIVSDVVPPEATVVPALVQRLPLSVPPSAWAAAVLGHGRTRCDQRASLEVVERSPFNIKSSAAALEGIYLA